MRVTHRLDAASLLRPFCLLLCIAALALAGCEKRSKDVGSALANVYYLKSWTYVRAEPGPKAKALAKAGPNARATVAETSGAWSRVSFDDGRVKGWVETSQLSETPVKETRKTSAAKPAPPKKSAPQKAKTETPKPQEAASPQKAAEPETQPAPQKAPEVAPEPEQKAPPVTMPIEASSEPSVILLSPAEAQAATGPADAPAESSVTKKQAKPEAFDPF